MRSQMSLAILALALSSVLVSCASKPRLDFGDSSPGNLWYQAYYTWQAGDRDRALIYADKLIELYGAEAKEMQASLSNYPPTDPPEATHKYGALNAVGTAFLIKGRILMEKGNKPGAREAFNTLIKDFTYAQYQDVADTSKWWKPAEMAKQRLAELQADNN